MRILEGKEYKEENGGGGEGEQLEVCRNLQLQEKKSIGRIKRKSDNTIAEERIMRKTDAKKTEKQANREKHYCHPLFLILT